MVNVVPSPEAEERSDFYVSNRSVRKTFGSIKPKGWLRRRLELLMRIRVKVWEKNKNSVSVERGPLTCSLRIGERWVRYGGTVRDLPGHAMELRAGSGRPRQIVRGGEASPF